MMLYERTPSSLFECSINAYEEKSLVKPRMVLNVLGFSQNDISQSFDRKIWSLKVFSEDKKVIESLKQSIKSLKLVDVKVSSKTLKPNQWLTKWKTHWKPLSLTKQIDIVPAWYQNRYKTKKQVIFLDTLMSFGTGMHETTRLVAQLMEKTCDHVRTFLDIGTGTGILALTALKLGVRKVTAMDISPLSVQAAESNFKVNKLKAKIILSDINRFSSIEKYDLIAANLITDDLLRFKKKIFSLVKPGGTLIVSGISLDNLARLKKGFEDSKFILRQIRQGKEWAAIHYEKKM